MRPIDLSPPDSPAVVVEAGSGVGGSRTAVTYGVIAVLAVVGLAAYFGMARVNSLKEKTTELQAASADADKQKSAVEVEIAQAGASKGTNYAAIASNKQGQLSRLLGERVDYALMQRELGGVPPMGTWFESADASAGNANDASGGAGTISLVGYTRSTLDLAALVQRLNSTRTIAHAEPGVTTWKRSASGANYLRFVITGSLQSSPPPSTSSTDSTDSTGSSTGSALVGGPSDGPLGSSIALEPHPGYNARQAATIKANTPLPPTPLERAAQAAGGGKPR